MLPRSLYCKANASEVTLPVLDAAVADGLRAFGTDECVERVEEGVAEMALQVIYFSLEWHFFVALHTSILHLDPALLVL